MKGDTRWRGHDKMQHDKQPANNRQPEGEVDMRHRHIARRRRRVKRMRGGGGATTRAAGQQAPAEPEANGGEGISRQEAQWEAEDEAPADKITIN
jgi:hypothetical protein